MQLFRSLFLVLLLPVGATAQNARHYFDADGRPVEKDKAYQYVKYTPAGAGKWEVEKRTLKGDTLIYKGISASGDSVYGAGHFTYFFRSGFVSSEGDYKNDRYDGTWIHYHDSSKQIWYTDEHKNGRRNGMLTSYYRSGKLKRKEMFADSLSKGGNCWDEDGKEIPFTPFTRMPAPAYNLGQYLSNTIRYPEKARRKNIEGKVFVYFVVNTDGSISDVSVRKGVHYLLDDEAVRVIENMANWTPGAMDDEPVRVAYTQPITFRLQ